MKKWWFTGMAGTCALMAALLLAGCAGSGKAKRGEVEPSSVLVETSHRKPPKWISVLPEEEGYLYFLGTAGDAATFDEGKKEAIKDALRQVVETIGVTVTSEMNLEEQYYAEQYSAVLLAELTSQGRAKLQDAEVKEIYQEKYRRPDSSFFFRVYVLLRYARADIEAEQRRIAELAALKSKEVSDLEGRAAQFVEKNMYFEAVQAYVQAAVAALKVGEGGEVYFDRNLVRAGELVMQFRIEKAGDNQTCMVGEPLPEPLTLRVYTLRDGSEVPVSNLPVTFTYRVPRDRTSGYKVQVYRVVTGSGGTVSIRIDRVYEVSDRNRVDARIDLSALVDPLRDAPASSASTVEVFRDIVGAKKTTFHFASDTEARTIRTALYLLQLEQGGGIVLKPVTAPVLAESLYDRSFDVRVLDIDPREVAGKSSREVWEALNKAAGRNVRRILYGTVEIVEFDDISGFIAAKARGVVTLYDRETEATIRSWELTRSGTGRSREAAQNQALIEVGRSLGEVLSRTMP
jgi:hypothetical protein